MQIQGVVSESKRFLKTKNIETPDGENSYEAFSRVLANSPGDTDAQIAMDNVKDNIYSVAITVQNQGNWDQARSQLQELMQVETNSDRGQKLLATVDAGQEAEQAQVEAQARIADWLTQADDYVRANQLVTPNNENAYALFNKVLEQDSANAQAQVGIEQIKDQIFADASAAQEQGSWDESRSQLQALKQIEPNSDRGQKLLATIDEGQAAEQAQAEAQTRIENWLVQANNYVKSKIIFLIQ
jgi:outer membrane protein assembly factor BamD (BamD/ComL family)